MVIYRLNLKHSRLNQVRRFGIVKSNRTFTALTVVLMDYTILISLISCEYEFPYLIYLNSHWLLVNSTLDNSSEQA